VGPIGPAVWASGGCSRAGPALCQYSMPIKTSPMVRGASNSPQIHGPSRVSIDPSSVHASYWGSGGQTLRKLVFAERSCVPHQSLTLMGGVCGVRSKRSTLHRSEVSVHLFLRVLLLPSAAEKNAAFEEHRHDLYRDTVKDLKFLR
jgi:hypothetical protein